MGNHRIYATMETGDKYVLMRRRTKILAGWVG